MMRAWIESYAPDGIFTIAEAGTSHGGDLRKGEELIKAAALAGLRAIKFQVVFADELLHPQSGDLVLVGKKVNLYQKFKSLERDESFFAKLKKKADHHKLLFLASCFGTKSARLLENIGVAAHKIASPELNYYHLWHTLLKTGKPIFFSTGMSRTEDLTEVQKFLAKQTKQNDHAPKSLSREALLLCQTCYPAQLEHYNLLALITLAARLQCLTGLSDHTERVLALPVLGLVIAVLLEQPFILEKHITLTRQGAELDDAIARTPDDFSKLTTRLQEVKAWLMKEQTERLAGLRELLASTLTKNMTHVERSRTELLGSFKEKLTDLLVLVSTKWQDLDLSRKEIGAILGDGRKTLAPCELPYYRTTKRSLLATHGIAQGEALSADNSRYLRAEQGNEAGLPPQWEEAMRDEVPQRDRSSFCAREHISSGDAITQEKLHTL